MAHRGDRPDVARAFADWVWVPRGAGVHDVAGGRLIRYPAYTGLGAWVRATPPAGATEDAVAETVALARALGERVLSWPVPETPENEGLASLLVARGATVAETLDRLFLPLEPPPRPARHEPRVPHPVRPVLEETDARGLVMVEEAVFGTPAPTARQLRELVEELRTEWAGERGARLVAVIEGAVVGCGGLTRVGRAARLWGGATLPEARGRGVYSAVVAERLRLAVRWGATLALVKGRVETSAPLLRRFGFRPHGRELTYRLPLG